MQIRLRGNSQCNVPGGKFWPTVMKIEGKWGKGHHSGNGEAEEEDDEQGVKLKKKKHK